MENPSPSTKKSLLKKTKEQLDKYYNLGHITPHSKRNVVYDPNYKSNVSSINKSTFYQGSNKLLSVSFDTNEKTASVYNFISQETEDIKENDEIRETIAKLVTKKLNDQQFKKIINKTLFTKFDYKFVLLYVLLKHPNILKNFDHVETLIGSANYEINATKENVILEAKQYIYSVFKNLDNTLEQTWYQAFLQTNQSIEDVVLYEYITAIGGKRKKRQTTHVKRSKEKVIVDGKERLVYIGPRGGKYIKVNNRNVLLSSLVKTT
jgi:hypothetical protein